MTCFIRVGSVICLAFLITSSSLLCLFLFLRAFVTCLLKHCCSGCFNPHQLIPTPDSSGCWPQPIVVSRSAVNFLVPGAIGNFLSYSGYLGCYVRRPCVQIKSHVSAGMALCRGSTRSQPLWAAFPSTVQAFGQPGSPAALRLSLAPWDCLRGGGGLSEGGVAGLRLREPSLAWHLLWGTPCLWETQGASWMGQDPCQCPRHSRVSGLGKAVSGPWGQEALGARPAVAESLLLNHHR